jgi:hypothetical protein
VLKIVHLHADVPRTGGKALIYHLNLSCRNTGNFPTNISFYFFRSGVTVVNFVLQTTPKEKITRIKIGERARQIPLLIILSLKSSDKACTDIRAVWVLANLPEISHIVLLLLPLQRMDRE